MFRQNAESIPTSKIIKSLLHEIHNQHLPTFTYELSDDEVEPAYDKWQEENLSTSPSGRHLSRCKSLRSADDTGIEINDIPNLGKTIMLAHIKMLLSIIKTSYSLKRWQTIDSMMLETILCTPRIDKLRVIHIYEGEYNLFFCIFWARRMMKHYAEQHKYIVYSRLPIWW